MKQIFIILTAVMLQLMAVCAQKTERMSLDGRWDFCCSDGQNSGKWGKITVPCSWELQGYGEYTYGRFYKTKGLKPSTETGRYRRTFTAPQEWKGRCTRLVFEGSMTDTEVWIDGKLVNTLMRNGKNTGEAVHQGGFTEFAYDITPYIIYGKEQTIEVLVKKESENQSINSAERRADWWLFGGIYRPVHIDAMPMEHIDHVAFDAREDGHISAMVRLAEGCKGGKIGLSINGRDCGATVKATDVPGVFCMEAEYPTPIKWEPEHPFLYNATVTLRDANGNALHEVTERIGFRTIEFRRHDGIYMNGTRLVVKGTNRHCFWPETGRTVTREQSLRDALLIKGMNMNAVRGHYPPDRHFLEICDSIGLLYLDELPGWQTRYDDTTAVKMIQEFIPRDVNHPCVFIWSNGNEGGWNTKIDHLFGEMDIQKRKVVHPWADYDGIDTHHYPAYQTGTYRMQNGQNVFMPTEFLHSKYDKGAGAALEDMWSHWTRSPLFAGGFIWAYVDEAVRRTDMPTGKSKGKHFGQKGFSMKDCILDSDGGNGPDGCLNAYREPEASYYTIREVWSPIYIDRLNITPSFDGRVRVENRYLFTNLSECTMRYRLKNAQGRCIMEGGVELPKREPGEAGYAQCDLPKDWSNFEIMELVAYDVHSNVVCEWSAPIHRAEEQRIEGTSKAVIEYGEDGRLTITAKGIAGGKMEWNPIFTGMRADCYRHAQRTEADGTVVNTYWYRGGIDSIQWRQTPDGLLHMDAVMLNDERGHGYKADDGKGFLTDESKWQLGLSMIYPEEEIDSVKWMGRGPYRVWRNRLKGQQMGVWKMAYNNTVTGEYNSASAPLYPEFKGYRADMRWAEFVNRNGRRWKVYSETEGLYLRLFTPEEATDQTPGEMGGLQEGKQPKKDRTMVKFPEGNISFLLSIPPMQSYKPLEQLGPLSQPDNIRMKVGDEGYHIRLVFDFD